MGKIILCVLMFLVLISGSFAKSEITNTVTSESNYLLNKTFPYMGEAYLKINYGYGPVRKGYMYSFSFMEAVQKLPGGYIIAVSSDLPGYFDALDTGGYELAFLRTEEKYSKSERIAFEGYCIGTYKYMTVSGFDNEIPAFRKLTDKEIKIRYKLDKERQEKKLKIIRNLPPLEILSHEEKVDNLDLARKSHLVRRTHTIIGVVRNNTDYPVKVAKIEATFYSPDFFFFSSEKFLGTAEIKVYNLGVGRSLPFEIRVPGHNGREIIYGRYELKATAVELK